MEEHFNENYIESDQFPKSTFKGKVLNFDNSNLVQGKASNFDVEGDLTLHGVTKKIKSKISITPTGDKMVVTSNFSVKLEDYQIKVPSLVKGKIAESAKINLKFDLEEKK
jgi:polyisoprenoid-binding protein YceI